MKRALSLLSVCAVLAFAFAAAPTHAATDVTGSWTTQMATPDGNAIQLTFHFKQDGDKLTGTVESPVGGEPIEITNGKVDGDKITFDTSVNNTTIDHEGTVSGDEIKLNAKTSDGSFPAMDMTLMRKP